MFLLNEIIQNNSKNLNIDEIICLYDLDHKCEFAKGDLVYFDDYASSNLFLFYQALNNHGDSYREFVNFKTLFNINKSIFDYINCVGEIKKITQKKLSFKKGSKNKVKYQVDIKFPDGNILKFNNIKYLKLYHRI
jgi:hypothetical protein